MQTDERETREPEHLDGDPQAAEATPESGADETPEPVVEPTSIGRAWQTMAQHRNITAEEAKDAVLEVVQDLANQCGVEIKPGRRDTPLAFGYSMSTINQDKEKGQMESYTFTLKKMMAPAERVTVIGAYANGFQAPMVTDPENPEKRVMWTEEDGEQRAWIVRKLQEQVVGFIEENK